MSSARLSLTQRKIRVYRVSLSDLAGVSGVAFELIGVANKIITLRHIQMSKPSVALTPFTLEKLSSASTGGTSTTPTPVPMRASDAAAGAVIKLYTVAPVKGALIDQIQEIDVAIDDVLNEHYGDNDARTGAPRLEAASQVLAGVITVTSILNGYIEWQEEP